MRLISFPPVVAQDATVLILGSMPGSRSLAAGQYYAHPHNLFWRFMAEIYGVKRDAPYAERLRILQAAGVALWDVLKECEREGSLDADIIPASERPNDFKWLLTTYPSIRKICFNGSKAATAFKRLVLPTLVPSLHENRTLIRLPSTSPANRSIPTDIKREQWRAALTG